MNGFSLLPHEIANVNSHGLFRAQSVRRLMSGPSGYFPNPNLLRVRRPKNSGAQLHRVAGSWMAERFGTNYREVGLFCTGDKDFALGYSALPGMATIRVWPLGDYSVCFSSRCRDLYGHFQFQLDISDEQIILQLENLDFREYRNEGLEEAAASKCEVMIFAENFRYCRV